MATAGELTIILSARDEFSAHLRGLNQDLQRLDKQVESTGGGLSRLGQIGLAGAGIGVIAGGVTAAVGAIGGLVTQASDLNEQLSKTGTVFGDASREVVDFAKTTSAALGISRTQALEAAGALGTLFTASGLGQDAAAGMSTELVRLAADLASFNNLEVGDALDKLRSGLTGEAEPLRALGVLLSEDAVKAEALALGFGQGAVDATKARAATAALTEAQVRYNAVARDATKTAAQRETAALAVQTAEAALNKVLEGGTATLTEAQKVQARYSLLLKQTATAQGDFARTSTGLANALRIIRASWADITTQLGQAFLPIAARAATFLAQQLPRALALVERAAESLAPALAALFAGDFRTALEQAVVLARRVGERLGPALGTWKDAFVVWVQQVTPPLLEALKVLGGAFAWIKAQAPGFLERLIGEWVPAFTEWVVRVLPPLLVELGKVVAALSQWVQTTGRPELEALGLAMGAAVVAGFGQALQRLGPLLAEHVRTTLFPGGPPRVGYDPSGQLGRGAVLSPAAVTAALAGTGVPAATVVNVGDVQVATGGDPAQIARDAGNAVAQQVLEALTAAAAGTDPGPNRLVQGAGR